MGDCRTQGDTTRGTLGLIRSIRPAFLLLVLLSACASERWVYEKANVTRARLDHDLAACRKEALAPGRFAIFRSDRVDQAALNRCMERRGYTPRRES